METPECQGRALAARRGVRFLLVLLGVCAGLVSLAGCTGEDDPSIHIQDPHPGQVVQTRSVRFSVALDPELRPASLRASLNGIDVSRHLRLRGQGAEGFVPLSTRGKNTLVFEARSLRRGMVVSQVRFVFQPRELEDIEVKETIPLPGLYGAVEVLVDPWGVHHIYTIDDPDDLAYAQGYFTARHRLFQIDFFRKAAEGRLAELLGVSLDRSVLETDLFFRTMFLTYERGSVERVYDVLAEELAGRFPDKFRLLQRYVEGVNDYIQDMKNERHGAALPQQYRLLNLAELFGVLPGSYEVEPMTAAQVLALGRLQQYELSQTLYEEIDRKVNFDGVSRAEALGAIPPGSLLDLYRSAPPDPTTILKPGEPYYSGPGSTRVPAGGELGAAGVRSAAAALGPVDTEKMGRVLDRLQRVERVIRGGAERPFSNNWVVSPDLTASGFAILANDPHLGLSNPSVFYPGHADNKTFSGGTLNASGCTFPGVPGLMLGQNENLAWGGTVANYDVTDLYEEEVTVVGGRKFVTYYGELVEVETITERFHVRGGDPVDIDIDFVPHHGPQLPGDPYSADPGLTPENNLTVQWTGHYLTDDLAAFLGLLEAENIDDFFAAVAHFGVGAQNFVGADTEGNIGYYPHALIPVRKPAALTHEYPPYLPLPGTGGFEWETDAAGRPRFLPPEQVPQARNPERGWLLTANNDIVGLTLDNDALSGPASYLNYQYNEGFRGSRAEELLTSLDRSERDLERMKVIQSDHVSLMARRLRPYFMEALSNQGAVAANPQADPARFEEALAYVAAWDLRCRTGMTDGLNDAEPSAEDIQSSIASSIFFVWMNLMISGALDDELEAAGARMRSADRSRAILHILENVDEPPGSPHRVHTLGPDGQSLLWNDVRTPQQESRDEIMVQAMVDALKVLDERMGTPRMSDWRWGKIHQLTLRLEGLGSVVHAFNLPSYGIFQQGRAQGYPRQGGWQTVDPANYGLGGLDFNTYHGAAMRMVVELEPGVMRAYNVIPGGVNDLQPGAHIFGRPVQIDPETHYGDQLPLWLANEYRPQLIFYEDVAHVAQYRISCRPE